MPYRFGQDLASRALYLPALQQDHGRWSRRLSRTWRQRLLPTLLHWAVCSLLPWLQQANRGQDLCHRTQLKVSPGLLCLSGMLNISQISNGNKQFANINFSTSQQDCSCALKNGNYFEFEGEPYCEEHFRCKMCPDCVKLRRAQSKYFGTMNGKVGSASSGGQKVTISNGTLPHAHHEHHQVSSPSSKQSSSSQQQHPFSIRLGA